MNIGLAVKTLCLIFIFNLSWTSRPKAEPATEDYCMSETFKPQCPRNEVILMKSATFGRMRIGRCITAEEAEELGPRFGEDPRYIGCSADVLPILDRKCSGKAECEVRSTHISDENIKPCFSGLTAYFEVSYTCIDIVDGDRSCLVMVSKIPAYITESQRLCGTGGQPWILEAPFGQTINISLFDFTSPEPDFRREENKESCRRHGLIADKAGKRNTSICTNGERRQSRVYQSAGNVLQIIFDAFDQHEKNEMPAVVHFILKVEAVGCSGIVPLEDAWLKRSNDVIVIGCYSSPQTWRLTCKEGLWAGVIGNCSKDNGHSGRDSSTDLENEIAFMSDKQVLAIVAIGGFTLTICLVIVCSGAVYLRRFYVQFKKKQEYKTLTFHRNSASVQRKTVNPTTFTAENVSDGVLAQQIPTYPVYAGQSGSINVDDKLRADIKHQQM